ncbi:hypothetical protein QTL95_24285 [Rhizobium sp. S152]|uniref:hypothetical protein n=1 Tax=Rhizobium sp. S152 TaxID=3055038 RepID=UPI0025A9B09E|nr:hypothetical protein [Rhizobium sp. S152]MDM9629021.1 hypothetical protein [Rhizobium sp. S152]
MREHVRANRQELPHPYPAVVLFFSFTDGSERAVVTTVLGADFDAAWNIGVERVMDLRRCLIGDCFWLRVDWPMAVAPSSFGALDRILAQTKRNYFRFGLSLDNRFDRAFIEQELNANAMLDRGGGEAMAGINATNFSAYARRRFPDDPPLSLEDTAPVHIFTSKGVFFDGDLIHDLYPTGRNAGRRVVDRLTVPMVTSLIDDGAEYLARQVDGDGRFYYGLHAGFGRSIENYNALRHASTTYAMVEALAVTESTILAEAIERSLSFMVSKLIRDVILPDGKKAAFVVEADGEIKLGGNAAAIIALVEHARATGDRGHLGLIRRLAAGLCFMRDRDSGGFRHVLNYPSLHTKQTFRIVYYDGEAVLALLRLYGLTADTTLLTAARAAFDTFIAAGHARYHDHWLAYCAEELTQHCPEERYYRFAIDNIADRLDFVSRRITTFPTLLELMMATCEVFALLKRDPIHGHLLARVDFGAFDKALTRRAHHLLNGHFWPELAMDMHEPARVSGSFFIRHHAFRTRIDDVEHYLSGFIAYRRHLLTQDEHCGAAALGTEQKTNPGRQTMQFECFTKFPTFLSGR